MDAETEGKNRELVVLLCHVFFLQNVCIILLYVIFSRFLNDSVILTIEI
jgi:TRAP-type mannitol/chloroaromatic compound transport system permease small subunit